MHITSLNLLFLFSLCLILFILPLTTTPSLSPYVLLYHSWTYFFPPFVLFLLFSISNLCLLPLFPFLSSFFHLSFTHPFVLASTPFVFLAVYLFPSVTHTSFPSASFFFFICQVFFPASPSSHHLHPLFSSIFLFPSTAPPHLSSLHIFSPILPPLPFAYPSSSSPRFPPLSPHLLPLSSLLRQPLHIPPSPCLPPPPSPSLSSKAYRGGSYRIS